MATELYMILIIALPKLEIQVLKRNCARPDKIADNFADLYV